MNRLPAAMPSGRPARHPGPFRLGRRRLTSVAAALALSVWAGAAAAQDAAHSFNQNKWSFGGYAETLQSAAFADDLDSLEAGNLIHNRLKLQWRPADAATADMEVRNRLYFGDAVRDNPGLGRALGRDPGWADLAFVPVDEAGAVWSLAVDRAWAEWNAGTWRLTAGRQRVNWGMALAWNPNDLFNAYDFLDFDYEERPGSDAMRWQWFPSWPVTFDAAAKADGSRHGVGALRLGWNRWEYDFQALGGWYHDDAALGAGWAGNLGSAGFKGEVTGFAPAAGTGPRSLEGTVTLDYALESGTYAAASALYNSRAAGDVRGLLGATSGLSAISPENLFPSHWAFLAQVSRPFTLIFNGSLALLYAPDLDAVMAMPTLSYNLATDWDLEGLAQLFATAGNRRGWLGTGWRSLANAFYLRLRKSF